MDLFNDFEDLVEYDLIDFVEEVNGEDRHPYTVRPRTDHLNKWDDKEFVRRFRISKITVLNLLEDIQEQLSHRTDRNHAVSPLDQLLLTLHFLATGSFYITSSDLIGVNKSTGGKIINRVVNAIADLRPLHICFPQTDANKQQIARDFFQIARFPRVIGALDCTHVRLLSPGGENAENFRNRKGYFSLNVQAICAADNTITDLVARWPGSAHDNHIFNNSQIRMRFETGEFNNYLLLGDSGYPVKSFLLTPLANPHNESENLYNESQIRTRNVIERTFGIWKRRFPVLSIGLRCRLPLAQKIIIATTVLHNLACKNRDELPDNQADIDPPDENVIDNPVRPQLGDDAVRRTMVHYFSTLI